MENEEIVTQEEHDEESLSDRCKEALEKSYGSKIPLPKSMAKLNNKKRMLIW